MKSPDTAARIVGIETFAATYPVTGQFKFFTQPTRGTIVVKITSESGHAGWGQSVPSPTWSYETLESVRTIIDRYLAPALLGMDAFATEAIWRTMNRAIAPAFSTGQPIAKAGIDLALFDLTGRILQHTAAQRWQVQGGGSLALSWTISAQTLDDVQSSIADACRRGYRHFNVKVGGKAEFDLEMCREIRRLAPDAFVWVDANGAYELQHPAALNGHQYLGGSVLRSPVLITGDQAEVPDGIGLGVEVDEDHLNAMA